MSTPSPLLPTPRILLFDWHGTLVDTQEAMTCAMEDMLNQLEAFNLVERLVPESQCRSPEDVKLVRYIRIFRRLHPRILLERRVSRTEIFNAIFGHDAEARTMAHEAYNECYRNYYGKVKPYQQGVREYLTACHRLGLRIGVATNRSREFLNHEIQVVDDGSWPGLIDFSTCADDVTRYKPDPQIIDHALANVGAVPQPDTWYIGDSFLDMATARNAGVTPIFYNGGGWTAAELEAAFTSNPACRPDAVLASFESLMDRLEQVQAAHPDAFAASVAEVRPPAFPPPEPPKQLQVPDWHPSVVRLAKPDIILFDWHATLVDTLDAMYHAVDDMLPQLRSLGLLDRLVDTRQSRSEEDARLVEYVRSYAKLHPKVRADRKISRTDIFEVLFGDDQDAKQKAHAIFTEHYRNHFGTVLPFEQKVLPVLEGLRWLGLRLGVITNRDREFFEHELRAVEQGRWQGLFDVMVCGDDTTLRKPHPNQVWLAAERLGADVNPKIWYVGDSTTDIVASKRAGITSVLFNGALWDQPWLNKIFPGTERFPYKPDVVVNDFSEFWALVLACLNRH